MQCFHFIFTGVIFTVVFGLGWLFACNGDDDDETGMPDDDTEDDDVSVDDDAAVDDDTQETDDDDDTQSDDDTIPGCESNEPPVLIALNILVNNVGQTSPIEVYQGDDVTFSIRYDDADCNLAGGKVIFAMGDDYVIRLLTLPDDLPCTSEGGSPFVSEVPLYVDLGPGQFAGEIYLVDACNADSNHYPVEFEIYGPVSVTAAF